MPEATKTDPAPLDAFATAKSDEPIWTVQGGDPLGGALLRIWSIFARIQAGVLTPNATNYAFEDILKAAQANRPEKDKEVDALLVRARETEEISWLMDNYRQGISYETEIADERVDEFERLDIYDIRRRAAAAISSFFSDLNEFREELLKHGWLTNDLDDAIKRAILDLRSIHSEIDVRRKG